MTPKEVARSNEAPRNRPLLAEVGKAWAHIEQARKFITAAAQLEMVDKATAQQLIYKLDVADYYMSKAWVLLIEEDPRAAGEALGLFDKTYKELVDMVHAAVESTDNKI